MKNGSTDSHGSQKDMYMYMYMWYRNTGGSSGVLHAIMQYKTRRHKNLPFTSWFTSISNPNPNPSRSFDW